MQRTCDGGQYDPSKSSTYQLLSAGGFNITYVGPGDSDAGDWATDTVSVAGGPPIQNLQFGVATTGADKHGVVGLGYDTNEAWSPNGNYPSIMDQMVAQNIIPRKAFSLYLDALEDSTGSIVFGGIDTTKYTGDLVGLPLQPGTYSDRNEFYVTLTSVAVSDGQGNTTVLSPSGYSQSVLLDSGTTLTLLTNDIYERLVKGFGAVRDKMTGLVVVPCDYGNLNWTIDYTFGGSGGPTIKVPLSQLMGEEIYSRRLFSESSGGCVFGFQGPLGGFSILGDTFLRSAYAVFDLDNNVAALAQARINQSATSSIIPIPSGTNLPLVSKTLSATGTQLSGDRATSVWRAPYVKASGTTLLAGSPTFNIKALNASSNPGSRATRLTWKVDVAILTAMVVIALVWQC